MCFVFLRGSLCELCVSRVKLCSEKSTTEAQRTTEDAQRNTFPRQHDSRDSTAAARVIRSNIASPN